MTKPKELPDLGTSPRPRCGTSCRCRRAKNGRVVQDCPGCQYRAFWGPDDSANHIANLNKEPAEERATEPAERDGNTGTGNQTPDRSDDSKLSYYF